MEIARHLWLLSLLDALRTVKSEKGGPDGGLLVSRVVLYYISSCNLAGSATGRMDRQQLASSRRLARAYRETAGLLAFTAGQ